MSSLIYYFPQQLKPAENSNNLYGVQAVGFMGHPRGMSSLVIGSLLLPAVVLLLPHKDLFSIKGGLRCPSGFH